MVIISTLPCRVFEDAGRMLSRCGYGIRLRAQVGVCLLYSEVLSHVACRTQGGTGSRENGRNVGYVGAREMALHSSSKDRSDAIAAVRYTLT